MSAELPIGSEANFPVTDAVRADIDIVNNMIRWAGVHRAVALGGLAVASTHYLAQDQPAMTHEYLAFNQQNFAGLIETLDRPAGWFLIGMAVVAHRVKVGLAGYRAHLLRNGVQAAGKHRA